MTFRAVCRGAGGAASLCSGELKASSNAGVLPYFLVPKTEGEPGGSFTTLCFFAVRLRLDALAVHTACACGLRLILSSPVDHPHLRGCELQFPFTPVPGILQEGFRNSFGDEFPTPQGRNISASYS